MLNNPLQIKRNTIFKFIKEIEDDKEYKSFETKASGYRAFINILQFYKRCRYNTIDKIFNKLFVDESDEQKNKCIQFISSNLNVDKDDIIKDNEIYILICYYLYAFLHNAFEDDTESILKAFEMIYNYIPSSIEFKTFEMNIDVKSDKKIQVNYEQLADIIKDNDKKQTKKKRTKKVVSDEYPVTSYQ
jgi:hypothetical protein